MAQGKEQLSTPELNLTRVHTIIFDMDGTLYTLDGDENGYKNSTLNKLVEQNTHKLVMEREACTADTASILLNKCKTQGQQFSIYFSNRYGISRKDFFDQVWNINPEGIVNDYEEAIEVVDNLAKNGKNLYLLTASPQIWQTRVLTYLGLSNHFSRIYSTESFINKGEVFAQLAQESDPITLLSIGDQYHTDIKPAQEYGLQTYHLKTPSDLKKLFK